MKLDYVNESSVVGNFETNSFGVKVSSKMFKIFSSNIYKYPVRAVIREYCCNARDSHIEAKTTENYELHLPTKLEPVFSVRDYGTGLSHNDVRNTFTQYFYSTKESSNDYVGCLGLGSKSLFSIVDSFLVTSWYDGEKSMYSCYMDEKGEPKIAHLNSVKSKEKNGLRVEASIKNEDIYKFKDEVNFVFKFMDKPICNFQISNQDPFDINTDQYSINYNQNCSSYVVMGGVAYRLEHKQIKDSALSKIVEHGVILYAPMGSVSFNPGREELSFDKNTIQWLEKTLTFVSSDIAKQLQVKVDASKSFFQAKRFVNSLTSIWRTIGFSLKYNDRLLNGQVTLPTQVQVKEAGKATVVTWKNIASYSDSCVYILVKKGQMSACKFHARKYKPNNVYFIDESLIDLIGLCKEDYIDGDTIHSKAVSSSSGKKTYVKKKINGYRFSYNRSISYCYNSVEEVPEGSIYFIFDRKSFTNDICQHSMLVELYLTLQETHKIPDIYGVKTPPEKGIHLIEWIKTNPQKKLFRANPSKYSYYLIQTDKDFNKRWNNSSPYTTSHPYFPKEIREYFKYDESIISEVKNLEKKFPLIDEVGYGHHLSTKQIKLIKETIDALSHQVK